MNQDPIVNVISFQMKTKQQNVRAKLPLHVIHILMKQYEFLRSDKHQS